MKTLADMTPQERANCIGMWCGYNRYVKGGEPSDFIIMVGDVNEAGRVPCVNPGAPSPTAWAPDPWMITPLPDLPRAWQADGQPPAGEWEYSEPFGKGALTTRLRGNNTTHRRWVNSWEKA